MKGIKTFHSGEGSRGTTDKEAQRDSRGKVKTNVKTLEALIYPLSCQFPALLE